MALGIAEHESQAQNPRRHPHPTSHVCSNPHRQRIWVFGAYREFAVAVSAPLLPRVALSETEADYQPRWCVCHLLLINRDIQAPMWYVTLGNLQGERKSCHDVMDDGLLACWLAGLWDEL